MPDLKEASPKGPKNEPTFAAGPHLFINSDSNQVNAQHTGDVVVAQADREKWLGLIQSRASRFTTIDNAFLFLLAPDKQTVYRHLLPPEYRFRQAKFLTTSPSVVDVAPALAALAKIVDVYPQTDSHWNHVGAMIAVEALLARLGLNMPDLVKAWRPTLKHGDLGHKVTPGRDSVALEATLNGNASLIYDNLIPNNGRIRISSRPRSVISGQPSRLLLFGDSFSYQIAHFLNQIFDIVVHMHSFAMDYRISEVFQPDIIIGEITERFVLHAPNPTDGEALSELWDYKARINECFEPPNGLSIADPDTFPVEAMSIIHYVDSLLLPFRKFLRSRPI